MRLGARACAQLRALYRSVVWRSRPRDPARRAPGGAQRSAVMRSAAREPNVAYILVIEFAEFCRSPVRYCGNRGMRAGSRRHGLRGLNLPAR